MTCIIFKLYYLYYSCINKLTTSRGVKSMKLIEMHKKSIDREKKKLGISNYSIHWIFFFRGVVATIIFERVFFN